MKVLIFCCLYPLERFQKVVRVLKMSDETQAGRFEHLKMDLRELLKLCQVLPGAQEYNICARHMILFYDISCR